MDNSKFDINIHCVVFGTDIPNNKTYILSTQKEDISFPSFVLTMDNITDLDNYLIKFLKNYIFVNDLELIPQLITLNSIDIVNSETDINTLNTIYGFIVNHTHSINNCYWLNFEYKEPMKYGNLLLEVIQKLK